MTQKAQLLRSNTAGHVPGAGSLLAGELAVNFPDKKLWAGDASGNPIDLLGNTLNSAAGYTNTALQSLLVSVKMFGATGDGTTDDTAAFLAARTYCQTNKRALFVPGGKYVLSQRIAWTVGAVTIYGEGPGLSVLSWTAAAATRGLSVTLDQDIHPCTIFNLTLETLGTAGAALTVDGTPQIVTVGSDTVIANRKAPRLIARDLNIRGGTDPFNNYWASGIELISVLICVMDNVTIEGGYTNGSGTTTPYKMSYGIRMSGGGHPCQFMVANSSIYGCLNGIWATGIEGLHVGLTDIVGVENGVVFDDSADTGARPHTYVGGCHINANAGCVYIHQGSEALIVGNDLYMCSDTTTNSIGYGVAIDGAYSTACVITGNNFSNSNATQPMTAVYLSNVRNSVVDGNTFRKYRTSGMSGIDITGSCADVKVGSSNLFAAESGSFTFKVHDLGVRTSLLGAFVTLFKSAATQATPANTATTISWDAVQDFQGNNGLWTAGTPTQVTVTVAGLYRISASVAWDATAGGTRQLQILASGSPAGAGLVLQPGPAAGTFLVQQVNSALIRLNAGDTVFIQATSSVTANVLNNNATWFCVQRVAEAW